jgi:NAD-dependent SIR2 family protein deacetylase
MKDYDIHEIHGNILKLRCTECSNKEKKLCYEPFESYLDIL